MPTAASSSVTVLAPERRARLEELDRKRWDVMLRRGLRRLVVSGIGFVARRPIIHALIKLAYPLLPGVRPFLRRFLSRPALVALTPQDVEAMLVFDRTRPVLAPGGVVTVEELVSLSRSV